MVVRRSEARAWSLGVVLLVIAMAAAWWWLSGGDGEPETVRDGETREAPRDEDGGPPAPALEMLAPTGSLFRSTDPVPADRLRLLFSTPEGARLCTVAADGDGPPLGVATCEEAGVDAAQARLAAVAADAPVAFVTPESFVRIDGSLWWPGATRAAFVGSPDGAAVLARAGEAHEVMLLDGTNRTGTAPAPAGLGPGSPDLVWDQLLWLERETPEGDRLRARPLFEDAEAVDVGRVPASSERLRGCRSSEALVVAVEGEIVHGVRRVAVTFLGPEGWSEPASEEAAVYEYRLTCRGSEATLTWLHPDEVGGTRRVEEIRCRPGRCEKASARVAFAGSDPMVSDLGGRVLMVWVDGDRTHARLAPLVELEEAENLPALPQPEAPVLARHLWVRGATAVLAYRTAEGTTAVRIDGMGAASPLPVRERSALQAP